MYQNLKPGDKVGGYTVASKLGEGAASTVFEVINETGTLEVLKAFAISDDPRPFEIEMEMMHATADLDGMVKYRNHYVDGDQRFIVMNHGGNTLAQLMRQLIIEDRQLSIESVRYLCARLTRILSRLHGMGLVYRDLKPDNIVLGDQTEAVMAQLDDYRFPNLQLADVGSCRAADQAGEVSGSIWTFDYCAPEVLLGDDLITGAADVWSLMVTLYEVAMLQLPFVDESACSDCPSDSDAEESEASNATASNSDADDERSGDTTTTPVSENSGPDSRDRMDIYSQFVFLEMAIGRAPKQIMAQAQDVYFKHDHLRFNPEVPASPLQDRLLAEFSGREDPAQIAQFADFLGLGLRYLAEDRFPIGQVLLHEFLAVDSMADTQDF